MHQHDGHYSRRRRDVLFSNRGLLRKAISDRKRTDLVSQATGCCRVAYKTVTLNNAFDKVARRPFHEMAILFFRSFQQPTLLVPFVVDIQVVSKPGQHVIWCCRLHFVGRWNRVDDRQVARVVVIQHARRGYWRLQSSSTLSWRPKLMASASSCADVCLSFSNNRVYIPGPLLQLSCAPTTTHYP